MKIICVDFEYRAAEGEHPLPLCMVAKSYQDGGMWSEWLEGNRHQGCPFPLGSDVLYVTFMATAEINCHRVLGWRLPSNVIDLHAEFRRITSGYNLPEHSLYAALRYFGSFAHSQASKDEMRDRICRSDHFDSTDKEAILNYCESDVDALMELLGHMWPHLEDSIAQVLLRGRYMTAISDIELRGVPVDQATLSEIRKRWTSIKSELIRKVDPGGEVYLQGSFRESSWLVRCQELEIPWPLLPSGRPCLDRCTFRNMSKAFPEEVRPYYQLRRLMTISPETLAVGSDGRNRYPTGAFRSKTGRNQPSSTMALFGLPSALRHLIKPAPGWGIAYIDYIQQELGIAAALSGDPNLIAAYESGDVYLAMAKMAGAVPEWATTESHPKEREQYKVVSLGVLMGMGAKLIGLQTNSTTAHGLWMLDQHKRLFPKFWAFSEAVVNHAFMGQTLETVFGWELHPGFSKPNTYRNFMLQAHGAEMLRASTIATVERSINVCCLVHDAQMIEAPSSSIKDHAETAAALMTEASSVILGGFPLRTDISYITYPNGFQVPKARDFWKEICLLCGITP